MSVAVQCNAFAILTWLLQLTVLVCDQSAYTAASQISHVHRMNVIVTSLIWHWLLD